jgi:ABC-2 type transport system permease protein
MIALSIAARELRSLFLSPLAWSALAAVQFIVAYLLLLGIDRFLEIQPALAGRVEAPGVTELVVAPLLDNTALVLLFVIPLLTMRVFSEERRAQTLTLLFSSPVSMTEIVLGKYLGLLGLLGLMLAAVALMALSLQLGTDLDWGILAAGVLGLALLMASFSAVGLYMSTLTEHPSLAAIATLVSLLLLWLGDLATGAGSASHGPLLYLSLFGHYQNILRGFFGSRDVVFFLLVVLTFLGLSIHRLQSLRLRP